MRILVVVVERVRNIEKSNVSETILSEVNVVPWRRVSCESE